MPELRRLAQQLFDRPLVTPPPLDDVAARARLFKQRRQVRMTAAAVACLLVISAVVLPTIDGNGDDGQQLRAADNGLIPEDLPIDLPIDLPTIEGVPGASTTTTTTAPGQPGSGGSGSGSTTTTTARPGGGGGTGGTTTTTTPPNPEACPNGQNAGATDVGVTATEIKVLIRLRQGSTQTGAQAVATKVNQAGGICGRRIALTAVMEPGSVDASQFFAVLPDLAGGNPDGVPVVGSEGLGSSEFGSAWSWPVGTPAAAQARIVVNREYYGVTARTFGIVHSTEAYGTEAASAFSAQVQKLGGTVKATIAAAPGKASYTGEAQQLASKCGCDTVVFALDARSLLPFIRDMTVSNGKPQGFGSKSTHALSPAVSSDFARNCGPRCDGVIVWAPFVPPVGQYTENPDVAAYRSDVQAMEAGVDTLDQAIERAYVGAKVLTAALHQVGANLTRARLRDALNAMTYQSGLTAEGLHWWGDRVANRSAVPLTIRMAAGAFSGFAAGSPAIDPDS